MSRLREFLALYRHYRRCRNRPLKAARYAWVVSGG